MSKDMDYIKSTSLRQIFRLMQATAETSMHSGEQQLITVIKRFPGK